MSLATELVESFETKKPVLVQNDIYLPLNHLFTAATKHAFKNEVKNIFNTRKTKWAYDLSHQEVTDRVMFFGVTVSERHIFDGSRYIANQINGLSKLGYVTGVMTKLGCLEMITEPHELPRYAVFSYVSVSPQGQAYIKDNDIKTLIEGECPPEMNF